MSKIISPVGLDPRGFCFDDAVCHAHGFAWAWESPCVIFRSFRLACPRKAVGMAPGTRALTSASCLSSLLPAGCPLCTTLRLALPPMPPTATVARPVLMRPTDPLGTEARKPGHGRGMLVAFAPPRHSPAALVRSWSGPVLRRVQRQVRRKDPRQRARQPLRVLALARANPGDGRGCQHLGEVQLPQPADHGAAAQA